LDQHARASRRRWDDDGPGPGEHVGLHGRPAPPTRRRVRRRRWRGRAQVPSRRRNGNLPERSGRGARAGRCRRLVRPAPRWRPPVRFYAQPTGNLRFLVQHAVDSWAGVFLYGEFRGTLVADSTGADVIVQADSVPDVPPDPGAPVYACNEVTAVPPIDTNNRF